MNQTQNATSVDELRSLIVDANPSGIIPVGGGTALSLLKGGLRWLPTTGLNRLVDYPVRDLTITVEAGMTMSVLQQTLRMENQTLPIEVPQAHLATVGGAIACDCSGPGRYSAGRFRDYVIGLSAVDGQGRLFSSGGRVVKNVAGYDLAKVLIGSRGRLAVITQVTLKVRPLPATCGWVWATFATANAAERAIVQLAQSATRPAALDLCNARGDRRILRAAACDAAPASFRLWIAFQGTPREVEWQVQTVLAELQPVASLTGTIAGEAVAAIWHALTEFPTDDNSSRLVAMVTLPPSQITTWMTAADHEGNEILARAGNGQIFVRLPETVTSPAAAESMLHAMQTYTAACGGRLDPWTVDLQIPSMTRSTPSPAGALAARLKSAFDPQGRFPS